MKEKDLFCCGNCLYHNFLSMNNVIEYCRKNNKDIAYNFKFSLNQALMDSNDTKAYNLTICMQNYDNSKIRYVSFGRNKKEKGL